MSDAPSHLGHRQRLRERFQERGAESLADYELLELLLMEVLPRRDVKPLAKQLLQTFGSLANVFTAPLDKLTAVSGVGERTAHFLKVIGALQIRARKQAMVKKPAFEGKLDMLDYLYNVMSHLKHEEFRVIYLDSKNHLLDEQVLFRGTVNASTVYPREVVKAALDKGATGLILVHNHPSGDPSPSSDDKVLTQEMLRIGGTLDILIHDHVIIGDGVHFSFRDHGLL